MTDQGSAFSNPRLDAPAAVRLLDVDDGVSGIELRPTTENGYRSLLAVARLDGRPLGAITTPVSASQTVDARALETAMRLQLGIELSPGNGSRSDGANPGGQRERSGISVVVPTCGKASSVVECVRSLFRGVAAPAEVVVVDNRPARSRVAEALDAAFGDDPRLRYVTERRPGSGRARNAGLEAVTEELVAFVDDDVIVDGAWLSTLRAAFAQASDAMCVTGLILPFELETRDQLMFERFGRFGKGYTRRLYRLDNPPADQPLFPYTPGNFGSGANNAFRTQFLRSIGGYDPALGAGTPARGGEDLDTYLRVLFGGGGLTYEPAAIVWHRHPEGMSRLRRQMFGYGIGLGATLAKSVARGPHRSALVRRVPGGIRYLLDPDSAKNRDKGGDFPRGLEWLERLGLLIGPAAYCASLWTNRAPSRATAMQGRPGGVGL